MASIFCLDKWDGNERSNTLSQATEPCVEATAKKGTVGTFTVKNTTKDTLRVTVNVRPWIQNRATGQVVAQQAREPVAVRRASPQIVQPQSRARARSSSTWRMTASGSLYAGFQVFAKQKKAKAPQRHHPAVGSRGEPAPEPDEQAPEPARRRHRRRRPRQQPLADPRGPQHRQHARSGRRHGHDHGPDGRATPTIPQIAIVPGQVVYLKGGSPERHEGWQLHRHVVDHPGRQALHTRAQLPALARMAMPRPRPCTSSRPRSWRRSGGAREATVRDVQEALNARGGKVRAYTTLLTVMTRLDAKGLLVRRRAGRLDVYAPALVARRVLAGARRGRGRGAGRGLRRSRARALRAPHPAARPASGWRSCAGWPNGG